MVLKLVNVLATWFGCGHSRWAPGTVGTLGALPLVWLLAKLDELAYMGATVVLVLAAIFVAEVYERGAGRTHDSSQFVFDEVVGFLVAMTWIPFTWTYVGVAFALFRLLDVVKPFPISWADRRIQGGLGVVADDLIAGIFTNIVLQYLLQNNMLEVLGGH